MKTLVVLLAEFFPGLAITKSLPKFDAAKLGQAAVLGVLALVLLASAEPAWSQIQLGSDIDGEAELDPRADSSPCPAMAREWRLGRLPTTATAMPQATCGSMSGHGSAWTQLGSTSTARRPMIDRATRSPCPAMAPGWRLGRL